MADELQRLGEDIRKVLKWVAAEYDYLQEVIDDLGELKESLDDVKRGKQDLKKALKEMRYASRSERRVSRFEKKLEADAEALAGMLPPKLKRELGGIKHKIKIAARALLKQASLYEGHIREELENIRITLGLLELEKGKKVTNLATVRILKAQINEAIDRVLLRIGNTIQWAAALGADLKEAERFEKALVQ